ncbi:RAD51-associated protein 1 [Aplysia californica]|uniref:RAD51-associated protein 1 n=1 Tax=Aplysia californica TaxID=6500 RepID=A0ABM0K432_APLCA|nr:RAD51-associated protein 1 [Aplysia californica]XP_005108288.1 RAD51-associated protein 1 [Aplysia californica]XP_005108290.1 RAD51-associated protein 1 [Aplysia californica]
MSDRRSSRVKKTINYSGCDDQSDDDFADTTPPPPKKTKLSSGDGKQKTGMVKVKEKEPALNLESTLRSKKQRKPLSDKAFDRELEEALQLSLVETGGSQSDHEDQQGHEKAPPPPLLSPIQASANNDNHEATLQPPPLLAPEVPSCTDQTESAVQAPMGGVPYSTVMDESIEVLAEMKEDVSSAKNIGRRQARKKAIVIESDEEDEEESDFHPEGDDSEGDEDGEEEAPSESDDGESDDSDFAPKSKSKKKPPVKKSKQAPSRLSKQTTGGKLNNITNTQAKATARPTADKVPVKSSTPAKNTTASSTPKPAVVSRTSKSKNPLSAVTVTATKSSMPPVKSSLSSPSPTSAPSAGSCGVPSGGMSAQWKPPAHVSSGGGATSVSMVKSPTSGLRLGLSRNQRVKPLHSSVKVT